jgi:lysozyme family protein
MADFLTAVNKTLEYEGGLVDNPRDPGGLTNFGIALKFHPELTDADIRNMTRTRAIGIYRQQYWLDLYDRIQSQVLANLLFDFSVTSGVHRAVQTLQGAIFLHNGPAFDGVFGPATLQAANAADQSRLIAEFATSRIEFYVKIDKLEFDHSWFGRTFKAFL